MPSTFPPAERTHVLNALDRMIAARKAMSAVLVDYLNGTRDDRRTTFDPAVNAEFGNAANKLRKYHPEPESLPPDWFACKEFAIHAEAGLKKAPGMSKDQLAAWSKATIAAITACTDQVVNEMTALRDATAVPAQRKRHRSPPRPITELTPAQIEAFELVGRHKGNKAAAAREAGVSATAIDKLYKKALRKLGAAGVSKRKVQALMTDVADPAEQSPPKGRVNHKRPTP